MAKVSYIEEFKKNMAKNPPVFFGPAQVIAEIIERLEALEDAVPFAGIFQPPKEPGA